MAVPSNEGAIKITLSTKKVVILREMKIKHQEKAIEAAAARAGNSTNTLVIGSAVQKELVKLLIVSVDDKTLSGTQKEDLDSVFTFQEYGQVMKVIGKITGDDEGNPEPTIHTIASGST